MDAMILLATCNGAAHLQEQLDSIVRQTLKSWRVLASDDASNYGSCEILRRFAQHYPLTLIGNPGAEPDGTRQKRIGFAANFLSLLSQVPDDVSVVALCDQDDIWLPRRLEIAITHLSLAPQGVPAMYCSRRIVWTPATGKRTLSQNYKFGPSFANACVENIAPSNTIVLNHEAAALARDLLDTAGEVYAHDWWLYLLISGVGGKIIFDPEPNILYRQHSENTVGAGEVWANRFANKVGVLRGVFRQRLGNNLAAMERVATRLTPDNRRCLRRLTKARQVGIFERCSLLRAAGVYRQARLSTVSFWGAACLGKI
jgi:glycosyltransferase involved in cell wall biosynthesis